MQPPSQPWPMPGPPPAMRVSTRDRDAVAHRLQIAFAEGRLDEEEFDHRVGAALTAKTCTDLDALIVDLPFPPPPFAAPPFAAPFAAPPFAEPPFAEPGRTNSLAIASLCFGIGQFVFLPFLNIPTMVLGILALRQIRRTGEEGQGAAVTGLALGVVGLILNVMAISFFL
jgi:hypothetical protein